MATKIQRAQALLDAMTNRATPQAQAIRLADAFAVLDLRDPATMTVTQKAELILSKFLRFSIATIQAAEGGPVAAAATAENDSAVEAGYAETQ